MADTPTLGELMDDRGLSTDDVLALLDEHHVTIQVGPRAGEPVDAKIVVRARGKGIPRAWRRPLGLESPEPDPEPDPKREREQRAPRRPADAAVVLEAGAQQRIAGAYRFLGAALAAGSGSQGVAYVFDDNADRIAELWIKAAEQNPWAARFVTMMQAGGTMGDLAGGHLYLCGATMYVLGMGIPAGDAIFSRYTKYRPVARPPAAENGSPPAPEPETVADDVAGPPVAD